VLDLVVEIEIVFIAEDEVVGSLVVVVVVVVVMELLNVTMVDVAFDVDETEEPQVPN
jgi:hypothetical protein